MASIAEEIPTELWVSILRNCDQELLLDSARINSRFLRIVRSSPVWRNKNLFVRVRSRDDIENALSFLKEIHSVESLTIEFAKYKLYLKGKKLMNRFEDLKFSRELRNGNEPFPLTVMLTRENPNNYDDWV